MPTSANDNIRNPSTNQVEMDAQTGFGATDLLLLLMTLIWGLNFTAIKYSLNDLLPLSFNGLRFAIAAVVMLVAARAAKCRRSVNSSARWSSSAASTSCVTA